MFYFHLSKIQHIFSNNISRRANVSQGIVNNIGANHQNNASSSRRNSIIVAEKYKDYQDPLTVIT